MEAPICERPAAIAAVSCRPAPPPHLRIRRYRADTDMAQVQDLERSCADFPTPNPNPNPNPNPSLCFGSDSIPSPDPAPMPDRPAVNPNPTDLFLLATSALGDPLARVCTYPSFCMMVAEAEGMDQEGGDGGRIVGVVRAGVKEVVRRCRSDGGDTESGSGGSYDRRKEEEEEEKNGGGDEEEEEEEGYVTVAYISGLRVAHRYRRLGVAQRLMREMEAWCAASGAAYCYLATEHENEASVRLFTRKLGYTKFRTPCILVQPVHARGDEADRAAKRRRASDVRVVRIGADRAEALYRGEMGGEEFFPRDIGAILRSPLSAGTWLAYHASPTDDDDDDDDDRDEEEAEGGSGPMPRSHPAASSSGDGSTAPSAAAASWAMLSVWRYDKLIRFELKPPAQCPPPPPPPSGAGAHARSWASRRPAPANKAAPGGHFREAAADGFGVQLVYGIHVAGPAWHGLLERLWHEAHGLAESVGSRALVVEVGEHDPVRPVLTHASQHYDLWCLKRLVSTPPPPPAAACDWTSAPPPASFFLDPRDF